MFSSTMLSETANMSKPCKVCASGYHYGAWTCDPCQRFFARCGSKGIENLQCYKNSDCDLSNRGSRIICRFCRFQKCLKVGMKNAKLHGQVQKGVTPNDMNFQSPNPSSSSHKLEFMISESSTMSFGAENMSQPCEVCAKPGHGNNYGAWTCDSCKWFFRKYGSMRTKSLICYGSSDCDLSSRQSWTICKLCRLKKCVEVGMKKAKLRSQVQRGVTPNDMNFQSPNPSSSSHKLEFMISESSTMPCGTVNMSKPCEVCGNPGHGYHYGAWTCDSCKWFFGNHGSTGIKSYGQAPRKSQSHQPAVSLTEPLDQATLRDLQEINDIYESYKEGCCLTTEKVRSMELKQFRMVNSESAELARVETWKKYSKEYETDIRALAVFVSKLQDSFNSHDKAILLLRSAFQLYLLRKVRALNSNGLILSDGRVIKMIDLELLYGIPLAQEMLQFVNKLLKLGCTDEDVAMFTTIYIYLRPGQIEDIAHLNLQNPENLPLAQQKFINLFMKHIDSRAIDLRVFQEMIKLCPELDKLNIMHQEALEFLKPYRCVFPEDSLFVKAYDLNSKSATLQNEHNLPFTLTLSNGSH